MCCPCRTADPLIQPIAVEENAKTPKPSWLAGGWREYPISDMPAEGSVTRSTRSPADGDTGRPWRPRSRACSTRWIRPAAARPDASCFGRSGWELRKARTWAGLLPGVGCWRSSSARKQAMLGKRQERGGVGHEMPETPAPNRSAGLGGQQVGGRRAARGSYPDSTAPVFRAGGAFPPRRFCRPGRFGRPAAVGDQPQTITTPLAKAGGFAGASYNRREQAGPGQTDFYPGAGRWQRLFEHLAGGQATVSLGGVSEPICRFGRQFDPGKGTAACASGPAQVARNSCFPAEPEARSRFLLTPPSQSSGDECEEDQTVGARWRTKIIEGLRMPARRHSGRRDLHDIRRK